MDDMAVYVNDTCIWRGQPQYVNGTYRIDIPPHIMATTDQMTIGSYRGETISADKELSDAVLDIEQQRDSK